MYGCSPVEDGTGDREDGEKGEADHGDEADQVGGDTTFQ